MSWCWLDLGKGVGGRAMMLICTSEHPVRQDHDAIQAATLGEWRWVVGGSNSPNQARLGQSGGELSLFLWGRCVDVWNVSVRWGGSGRTNLHEGLFRVRKLQRYTRLLGGGGSFLIGLSRCNVFVPPVGQLAD